MKLELGSEVIGPLITFFAIHSTPEANQVKVTESLNVFTGLLSGILFGKQKRKKKQSVDFNLTGICGCDRLMCLCM